MQFCLKRIPDYSVCIIHYFMVVVSNKQVYIFFFFIFSETRQVCETKECILAASSILKAMDQTVDPCTDFYKYACGGWERDTPIPPGYSMWDRIQELSYTNLHHLKDILGNQNQLLYLSVHQFWFNHVLLATPAFSINFFFAEYTHA